MSAEALDEQKMRVLLDYQNTENEITGIESSLEAKAALYTKFANQIRSATTQLYMPSQPHHNHNVVQFDLYSLPKLKDVDAVFDLADKLRAAKNQLQKLGETKAKLGLR